MQGIFRWMKKENRGFTLAEILIVVAIMLILSCVGFPAIVHIRDNIRQTELDDKAKSIFLAAQNRLLEIKATGSDWEGEGVVFTIPGSNEQYKYGYINNKDINNKDITWMNDTAFSSDNMSGSYVIEYDYKNFLVYGVFYWEENGGVFQKNRKFEYSPEDCGQYRYNRNERMIVSVGYYGGQIANGNFSNSADDGINKIDFDIEVDNAEELKLRIKDTSYVNRTYEVYINDNKYFTLDESVFSTQGEYEETLDSIIDSKHFENIVNGIIPGDDLKIVVIASDGKSLPSMKTDSVNSLFAFVIEDTAYISNRRHLQNLKYLEHSGKDVQSNSVIKKAKLLNDIDWGEDPKTSFEPINNSDTNLTEFDGNNFEIKNLKITSTDKDNCTGLFGYLKSKKDTDIVKIKNVILTNPSVNIENASQDTKTYAGSLIGKLVGEGEISNCGAYVEYPDDVDDGYDYYEKSGVGVCNAQIAGGLIGDAQNCKIENSFASIKVNANKIAGGLIGKSVSSTILSCYSGGHTKNGRYEENNPNIAGQIAGGLVGQSENSENRDIINSFSTTSQGRGNSYETKLVGDGNTKINDDCYSLGYNKLTSETESKPETFETITYDTNLNGNYPYKTWINKYYGDWPVENELSLNDVNVVYFEIYKKSNEYSLGLYYKNTDNNSELNTLRDDVSIYFDGYALLYSDDKYKSIKYIYNKVGQERTAKLSELAGLEGNANINAVSSLEGSQNISIVNNEKIKIDNTDYEFKIFPDDAVVTNQYVPENIYQRIIICDKDQKETTFYYCPHFAKSEIYTETTFNENNPIPKLVIRSVRNLCTLTYDNATNNSGYNIFNYYDKSFIQERNIDFKNNDYRDITGNGKDPNTKISYKYLTVYQKNDKGYSIGGDDNDHPFSGVYEGKEIGSGNQLVAIKGIGKGGEGGKESLVNDFKNNTTIFGKLRGATIRNLSIEDINLNNFGYTASVLCNEAEETTLENIHFNNVTLSRITNSANNTGILAETITGCSLKTICLNNCSINNDKDENKACPSGLIAGTITGNNNSITGQNSINRSQLTIQNGSSTGTGIGFGKIDGSISICNDKDDSFIVNSCSVSITAAVKYVGLFAGDIKLDNSSKISRIEISNSIINGKLNGDGYEFEYGSNKKSKFVGGFAGRITGGDYKRIKIENVGIKGDRALGGFAGQILGDVTIGDEETPEIVTIGEETLGIYFAKLTIIANNIDINDSKYAGSGLVAGLCSAEDPRGETKRDYKKSIYNINSDDECSLELNIDNKVDKTICAGMVFGVLNNDTSNKHEVELNNIDIKGTIKAAENNYKNCYAGGIAGYLNNTVVTTKNDDGEIRLGGEIVLKGNESVVGGVFGYIVSSIYEISNIKANLAYDNIIGPNIGGFIGGLDNNKSSIVIDQCETNGYLTINNEDNNEITINDVGGFIGYCKCKADKKVEINKSNSFVNIIGIKANKITNVGGFIAKIDNDNAKANIIITNCNSGNTANTANTDNNIEISEATNVGGFVGCIGGTTKSVEILNCISNRNITINNNDAISYYGGFIGKCEYDTANTIEKCGSYGNIVLENVKKLPNKPYYGGFGGYLQNINTVRYCYSANVVNPEGNTYGFVGQYSDDPKYLQGLFDGIPESNVKREEEKALANWLKYIVTKQDYSLRYINMQLNLDADYKKSIYETDEKDSAVRSGAYANPKKGFAVYNIIGYPFYYRDWESYSGGISEDVVTKTLEDTHEKYIKEKNQTNYQLREPDGYNELNKDKKEDTYYWRYVVNNTDQNLYLWKMNKHTLYWINKPAWEQQDLNDYKSYDGDGEKEQQIRNEIMKYKFVGYEWNMEKLYDNNVRKIIMQVEWKKNNGVNYWILKPTTTEIKSIGNDCYFVNKDGFVCPENLQNKINYGDSNGLNDFLNKYVK